MIFSLGATLLWGLWGVTAKLAADRLGHWRSALVYSAVSFLTILALSLANRVCFRETPVPGLALAALAGLFGGLAIASFQKAITTGPLSSSISMTALYPLIPVIYGIMLLGEEVTLTRGIGMGLALAAGVLLCL